MADEAAPLTRGKLTTLSAVKRRVASRLEAARVTPTNADLTALASSYEVLEIWRELVRSFRGHGDEPALVLPAYEVDGS